MPAYFLSYVEVMAQIPGAKKLKVELPIVIGSIPYNGLDSRSSSLSSHFSMDMSWLALALPEVPEGKERHYKNALTHTHMNIYELPFIVMVYLHVFVLKLSPTQF